MIFSSFSFSTFMLRSVRPHYINDQVIKGSTVKFNAKYIFLPITVERASMVQIEDLPRYDTHSMHAFS